MQSKIKDAVITTGVVLAVIFAMRQVAFTKSIVDRAISG